MSSKEKYLKDLADLYGAALSPADAAYQKEWQESLAYLGIEPDTNAALIAVQSLMPLVEELDSTTGGEFKELFASIFFSHVAQAVRKD